MPDPQIQEVVFERFVRGWNPLNFPPNYAYPRELREGEVMDLGGLRVTEGGQLRWERNQFQITSPGGLFVSAKSLLEFRTSDYNQLLCFAKYGAEAPYTGGLFKRDTPWDALPTPTQWDYGYRIPWVGNWGYVTGSLDLLNETGITGAAQASQVLLIAQDQATDRALLRWNGVTLKAIGLAAPAAAPSITYSVQAFSGGDWTEVDPGADITLNATQTIVTALPGNLAARVYRDMGEGGLVDFKFKFSINLTDNADVGGRYACFAVANQDDTADWDVNSMCLSMAVYTDDRFMLTICKGTTTDEPDTIGILGTGDYQTLYNVVVERNGAEWIFSLYTSEDVLLKRKRFTSGPTVDYRYIYSCAQWDRTSALTITAYVSNLFLYSYDWDAGVLTPGTYNYYYTYGDGEFVSMPSDQFDVQIPSDSKTIPLTVPACAEGLTRYIYRNYINSLADGVTGPSFRYVGSLATHTDTSFADNTPEASLGDAIAFDHARPPYGENITWHKDRGFMSGVNKGSPDYEGYATGYRGNILYWCELDEPYYWPGANQLVIGDDTDITGHVSWGDYLVIFKLNSVWVLTGYDPSPTGDYVLEQLTGEVGSVRANAMAAGPPGVIWAAPGGYYFWDGAAMRKVLDLGERSPWSEPTHGDTTPSVAYHDGRFYIAQSAYLLEWDVLNDIWSYRPVEMADDDGDIIGLRAISFGGNQSHILTRMAWVTGGEQAITCLDLPGRITGRNLEGNTYTAFFAPVQVALPPLMARPGEEIVPVEVWIDGSWDEPDEIVVAGAGDDSYNGIYLHIGTNEGKPVFQISSGASKFLEWDIERDRWELTYLLDGPLGSVMYYGDSANLPGGTWSVSSGDAPAPTVTGFGNQDAQHVKLFLNADAGYSETEGDNAWQTTPEAPQGGKVIGVPSGYEYAGPTYKTNAFQTLYVQVSGAWAKSFILNAVGLRYYVRASRGA